MQSQSVHGYLIRAATRFLMPSTTSVVMTPTLKPLWTGAPRIITDDQRSKWRSLRTLVDHFKDWQSGISLSKDRRTSEQKEIEKVVPKDTRPTRHCWPKSSRRVGSLRQEPWKTAKPSGQF